MPGWRFRNSALDSATLTEGVAGQAEDDRLARLLVQEAATLGHGRDRFRNRQPATTEEVREGPFGSCVDAHETSPVRLDVNGRKMDRIVVARRDEWADHMPPTELAAHGVADDLAAAPKHADGRALSE